MLDIRVIRENAPAIQERLKLRGGDHWKLVDAVLACDEKRRKAETEKQQLQNSRKTISKQIGMLKGKGQHAEADAVMAQVGTLKTELDNSAARLEVIQAEAGYREAQAAYFNSLYEYYIAKVDYLKASGKLTGTHE
mgnify:CR=1 FL=1